MRERVSHVNQATTVRRMAWLLPPCTPPRWVTTRFKGSSSRIHALLVPISQMETVLQRTPQRVLRAHKGIGVVRRPRPSTTRVRMEPTVPHAQLRHFIVPVGTTAHR